MGLEKIVVILAVVILLIIYVEVFLLAALFYARFGSKFILQ